MKRTRLHCLIEGHIEGTLSSAETQELVAACAEPAVKDAVVQQIAFARRMRAALRPARGEDLWRAIAPALEGGGDRGLRVAAQVDRAIDRRAPPRRGPLGILSAAAVFAAAAALWVMWRSAPREEPVAAQPPREPVPVPSETEARELLPPEARAPATAPANEVRAIAAPAPVSPSALPPPSVPTAPPVPPPDVLAAAEGPAFARREDLLLYAGFEGALPAGAGRVRPRFSRFEPGLRGQALVVSYGAGGSKSGGVRFVVPPEAYAPARQPGAVTAATDEVHMRYYVRLSRSFELGKGGVLPGLCAHPCVLRPRRAAAVQAWVAGLRFGREGELSFDFAPPSEGGAVSVADKRARRWRRKLVRGRWHAIEMRVKLNAIGQSDGVIEGFFDGQKVSSLAGLQLRTRAGDNQPALLFQTFLRGHAADAPAETVEASFDNLAIARGPVGTCETCPPTE